MSEIIHEEEKGEFVQPIMVYLSDEIRQMLDEKRRVEEAEEEFRSCRKHEGFDTALTDEQKRAVLSVMKKYRGMVQDIDGLVSTTVGMGETVDDMFGMKEKEIVEAAAAPYEAETAPKWNWESVVGDGEEKEKKEEKKGKYLTGKDLEEYKAALEEIRAKIQEVIQELRKIAEEIESSTKSLMYLLEGKSIEAEEERDQVEHALGEAAHDVKEAVVPSEDEGLVITSEEIAAQMAEERQIKEEVEWEKHSPEKPEREEAKTLKKGEPERDAPKKASKKNRSGGERGR